ncbi:MAG: FAD:protein FMN transferase [Alphaproteobacteria bacterium]|nr:MAG: FAD:protein FMN transferase [Alphaproteobacteria bacterium]
MSDIVCRKTYQIMGGEFQFSCFPQTFLSKQDVYELFDLAFAEVKRIEEKFTDFHSSYFSRINELAGVSPVSVDEETFYLIQESLRVSEMSNGVFDISFASIGHLWRLHKEKKQILEKKTIEDHLRFINYKLIQVNDTDKTVYLPYKEMKIGLGGIGKGYAVDQVYSLFIKKGLSNFYINGSGDIRVHSRVDAPRKWRIGIRNPLSKDPKKSVGVVQMDSGAIASSGGYIHNIDGDKFNNHIINPKTGTSATDVIASTVIAEDAITADTTATILMNLEIRRALEYLNDHHLNGVIFCNAGKSYLSDSAMKNFGMTIETRRNS